MDSSAYRGVFDFAPYCKAVVTAGGQMRDRKLSASPEIPPGKPRGNARCPQIGGRIVTACTPGVAASDPAESQPAPCPGAIELDRFQRILRAGGQVAAARAENRREGVTVEIYWPLRGHARYSRNGCGFIHHLYLWWRTAFRHRAAPRSTALPFAMPAEAPRYGLETRRLS